MRSSNPALKLNINSYDLSSSKSVPMTFNGTMTKSFILFLLVLASASWVWRKFFITGYAESISGWLVGGVIGGLVLALITVFKKEWASKTAPIYALFEGLFLGGISALMESRFPGIIVQAVFLTFGVFAAIFFIYKSGLIKITDKFRLGVAALTGGIFFVYLFSFIFNMFGANIGFIHSSGPAGIIFSLVVIAVAALNLMLDLDFIYQGSSKGLPSYMEWYFAFGLMVTLIWLYIEILSLLARLKGRD